MHKTFCIVALLVLSTAQFGGVLVVATVPGVAVAQTRNAPVLLTPAYRLIGQEDYPSAALRDGREGSTGVELAVGIDGRVHGCKITQSSGHADLDAATCAALQKRATFRPSTDSAGRSVAGAWSTRIRWALPQEPIRVANSQGLSPSEIERRARLADTSRTDGKSDYGFGELITGLQTGSHPVRERDRHATNYGFDELIKGLQADTPQSTEDSSGILGALLKGGGARRSNWLRRKEGSPPTVRHLWGGQ